MNSAVAISRLFFHSPGPAPRVRVGIVLSRWRVPLFVRDILQDLQQCDFIDVCCVVIPAEPGTTPTRETLKGTGDQLSRGLLRPGAWDHLLFRSYQRLVDARFRPLDDPEQLVDCSDLFGAVPVLSAAPTRAVTTLHFPKAARESLSTFAADVLLQFGNDTLPSEVINLPRFGVWSFQYSDSELYRGGPAGFWEMYERNPLSGVVLWRLADRADSHIVIARSQFATTDSVSVTHNRVSLYCGSRYILVAKLNELHRLGWDQVIDAAPVARGYHGRRKSYTEPSNIEMLKWATSQIAPRVIRRLLGRRRIQSWRVGLRQADNPLHVTRSAAGATPFLWLQSPRGH